MLGFQGYGHLLWIVTNGVDSPDIAGFNRVISFQLIGTVSDQQLGGLTGKFHMDGQTVQMMEVY